MAESSWDLGNTEDVLRLAILHVSCPEYLFADGIRIFASDQCALLFSCSSIQCIKLHLLLRFFVSIKEYVLYLHPPTRLCIWLNTVNGIDYVNVGIVIYDCIVDTRVDTAQRDISSS